MAEQQPKEVVEQEGAPNPYALTSEQVTAQNERLSTYVEDSSRKTSQPTYTPIVEKIFTDPPTYVRHTLGSSDIVASNLARISFLEGGGMSESIAYIRYWSRKGSQERTEIKREELNSFPQASEENLAGFYAGVNANIVQEPVNPYLPSNTSLQSFYAGVNSTAEVYDSSKIKLKGVEPSSNTTPSNFSRNAQSLPPIPTSGAVYSANPGGGAQVTPAEAPEGAVWQFLFNPEELEMSYGPDYNKAEAWGVSDPANSGQPMSWRANKNRKLVFSKILLHGYSIGRRVDELEKGLQRLFTARDGENGSDGPPVLEFVWGRRVFGPCVIQNISVREKAWDNGILVNAEVSFELEQVPEWTVNDGFVDILRPGRQPVVNDPTVASEEYREAGQQGASGDSGGGAGSDEQQDANNPGGNGGPPTSSSSAIFKKCKSAKRLQDLFRKKADRVKNWRVFAWEIIYQASRPFTNKYRKSKFIIEPEIKQYISGYNQAVDALGNSFVSNIPGEWRLERVSSRLKTQVESDAEIEYVFTQLRIACQKAETACKNIYDSKECAKAIENERKYEENKNNQRRCNLKAGDACPKGSKKGGRVIHPCTKKEYICDRNYRLS